MGLVLPRSQFSLSYFAYESFEVMKVKFSRNEEPIKYVLKTVFTKIECVWTS